MGSQITRTVAKTKAAGSKRQSILVQAAQEFCSLSRPTRKQMDRYRDLFYSLISNCTEDTKRTISICHANNPHTPRTIAYYLALDTSAVASPILLFSPVFNEKDLLTLAERTTEKHRQGISHRTDLTPQTIKVLAQHQDDVTLRMLAKNPVVLSNTESLAYLEAAFQETVEGKEAAAAPTKVESVASETTEISRTVSMPIVAKAIEEQPTPGEIEATAAIPPHGSLFQKQNGAETAAKPPVNLTVNVEQSKAVSAKQTLLDLAGTGGRLGKSIQRQSTEPTVSVSPIYTRLLNAARANDLPQLEAIISVETGLKREAVKAILIDETSKPLARLVCGLMVPKSNAGRLMLLISPVLGRDAQKFKEISAYFDTLSIAFCQQEIIDNGGMLRTSWVGSSKPVETPDTVEAKEIDTTTNLRQAMRSRRQVLSRSQRRSQFGRRGPDQKRA